MAPVVLCPSRDQLQALERGELEADALDALCEHLAECESCESIVHAMEAAGEGIVGNLIVFGDRQPLVAEDEYRLLEAKAKAIALDQSESPQIATPAEAKADATPADVDDLTQLGQYRLVEKIGQGGMGMVFKAVQSMLDKEVAIKVILPEYSGSGRMRARFKQEMKAAGALSHPNVVAAHYADEADKYLFFAMEFVDGLNLDALVRRCGQLPVAEACEIIRQAAVGLQYIHENLMVHRDLKPSNLMISNEGVVKILDLGLARVFTEETGPEALTRSHFIIGTEDYMAPEQWQDSHDVDIRADIYSLGCTFYKLLAGKAPFSGPEYKSARKKKLAHAEVPHPPILNSRSDVPQGVAAVLDRMLSKEPEARFGTPREVADSLQTFAERSDCRQLATRAQQDPVANPAVPATAELPPQMPRNWSWPANRNSSLVHWLAKRWQVAAGTSILVAMMIGAGLVGMGGSVKTQHQNQPTNAILADGIVPAKGEPAQSDQWHRLLTQQQPPFSVFREDSRLEFEPQFYPGREELWLNAPGMTMMGLGKTNDAGYRIQLDIRQTRWIGDVGLFFGWREAVFNAAPCRRCQVLKLINSNGTFQLARTMVVHFHGNKYPTLWDAHVPLARVDRPLDGEWCRLEMEVRWELGLCAVSWKGKALPTLVTFDANKDYQEIDYIGDFGIWNQKCESRIGNSQFKLFQR
jgi:serine/threonine protein kinase